MSRLLRFPVSFLIAICALAASHAQSPKGNRVRFFQAEPAFVRAQDLPEDFRARIDTVRFAIKDAFEGVDMHSDLEKWTFGVGNKLHIETREATIRQRMIFEAGAEIGKGSLMEAEKVLREEQFLADAIIEVGPDRDGSRTVKVTTYDQWTTALIASLALAKGNLFTNLFLGRWDELARQEWLYGYGLWESNVLGTGTRLGASYRHDLERNTLETMLNNQSFSPYKLQGSLYAASLSDGHAYHAKLALPLRSRDARWAFNLSLSSLRIAERIYFDANRMNELPDSLRSAKTGESHVHREYQGVTHDSIFFSVLRSYGRNLKVNVGPAFFFQDRYQKGGPGDVDSALLLAAPLPSSAEKPWLRSDALVGFSASIGQYAYSTARNYRNLKWNETVETGWRLTTRVFANQEWLGAGNSDLWLSQEAAYGESWRDRWYASCSLSTSYYLDAGAGKFEDGRVDGSFEAQWKPVPFTSSVLKGSWNHLFATPRSRQLVLGALDGLAGYPSFYFSGQARVLMVGEQRLFPEFELLTFVPAISAFLAAGNTFPTYADFDTSDLHYSMGFGFKLGKSKSPTKSVQHYYICWPIGEDGIPGGQVSFYANRSL